MLAVLIMNLLTVFKYNMSIYNNTCPCFSNVELPFSWVVVKPLLEPPDPEAEAQEAGGRAGPQERVQDVDTAFSIEPQNGMLPASGVGEFVITFAPPQVKNFSFT